jgi:hypothetical protein
MRRWKGKEQMETRVGGGILSSYKILSHVSRTRKRKPGVVVEDGKLTASLGNIIRHSLKK